MKMKKRKKKIGNFLKSKKLSISVPSTCHVNSQQFLTEMKDYVEKLSEDLRLN